MPAFDEELLKLVVCPRDRQNHRYRIIEGIPILLVSEAEQTHIEGTRALAVAEEGNRTNLPPIQLRPGEIDPFVKEWIGATTGSLYQHLVGKLTEYPVPALRLLAGEGRSFLEIGCNWGRWCLAAAQSGYRPAGIDNRSKASAPPGGWRGSWESKCLTWWRTGATCHSATRSSTRFFLTACFSISQRRTPVRCWWKLIVFCEKVGRPWFSFQTSSVFAASIISSAGAFARPGTLKSGTGRFRNSGAPSEAPSDPLRLRSTVFFAQCASQRFAVFSMAAQATRSPVTQLAAAFKAGTGLGISRRQPLRIRFQVKTTLTNVEDRINHPDRVTDRPNCWARTSRRSTCSLQLKSRARRRPLRESFPANSGDS